MGMAGPAMAEAATQNSGACVQDCAVLTALTIDGVTAYPMATLAPLYDGALAREVGIADLVQIAQRITDKYRADGYFLSRAVVASPPDASGRARIRVYEGYIDDVVLKGAPSPAVERILRGVAGKRPMGLPQLDRQLALASDFPGSRVRAQLEPNLDDPTRHRLVVDHQFRKLSGSLYLDNRGVETAGPWQLYGRGAVNSALISGDELFAGVLTTPQDTREFTQGEVGYSTAMPWGGRLQANLFSSRARDGTMSAFYGYESHGASVRLTTPVMRRRQRSVWALATLDVREVEQRWDGGGAFDELRVLRLGAQGDAEWSAGYSTGLVQVSRGLGGGGGPDLGASRYNASDRFWKINARGTHYRSLGRYTGVYVSTEGQWAPDPLLGPEEFAGGGLPYGRAYNYGEVLGDRGVAGLIELRAGYDPKFPAVSFLQSYLFLDGAKVWNLEAAPGFRSASLASAGIGLRIQIGANVNLRLEATRPLTRTPFYRADKDWRPFVSLSSSF